MSFIKKLIPAAIKTQARDFLGLTHAHDRIRALEDRVDRLEERLYESKEAASERSKTRWRQTAPTANLTWDRAIEGDPFIAKMASYGAFSDSKAILEIGPGYGRLLKAVLRLQMPFSRYLGLDISAHNVRYLTDSLPGSKVAFLHGDAETVVLPAAFDVMMSSLVFKHIFPSFEQALSNIARQLNPGGMVFFDLIEGDKRYFEADDVTYIRYYGQAEIRQIVERAPLRLVAFDEVLHDSDHPRLLVVASK